MTIKQGSLFDGSGGFPLSGILCGVQPRWASEVEPYPIAVTRERIPTMKHLGDISKINGAEIEPVDIITFGSPCQDLSVAGKRAGLKHESNGDEETTRSGLFMESVRIIKEMREATNGKYPRIAFWENVPGAFSSQRGEDLRVVLEELIKIAEPAAVMPEVQEKGWAYADCYSGDGWSIAYRVFDAQYWGVPQRRRRIHLVLDLGGQCAGEILFKRQGLRGYFETGRTPWQGITPDAQDRTGADDREGADVGDPGEQGLDTIDFDSYNLCTTGKVGRTVTTPSGGLNEHIPCVVAGFPLGFRPENTKVYTEMCTTLCNGTRAGFCNGVILSAGYDAEDNRQAVAYSIENHPADSRVNIDESGKVQTLTSRMGTGGGNVPMVMEATQTKVFRKGTRPHSAEAKPNGGQYLNFSGAVRTQYIVRRLTPTECARLQGFPDWWGHIAQKDEFTDEEYRFWLDVRNTHARINGKAEKDYTKAQMLTWYNKLHTDSAEYKMWGNGIALPPALYCMQGIVDALNAEKAQEETTEEAMSEIMEETTEETTEAESPLHDRNDSIDSQNYAFIALQALNTDTPEDDNIMEEKEDDLMDTTTTRAPADRELREQIAQTAEQDPEGFDAVERLYHLKDEREKLANLTGNTRFDDDVRALKYAVTVLEAVGL